MTRDEFAATVKEKYPAYRNMDNNKLVDAVLEKYPVYKDRISPAVSKPTAPELPQFAVTSPVGTMTARGAISETTIPAEMPDTGVPVGEMVAGVVQPVLQSKPAQFLLGGLISKEKAEDWSETVGRKYPESEILQKGVAAIGAVGQIITPLDLLLYGTGTAFKGVKAYKAAMADISELEKGYRLAPEAAGEISKVLDEESLAELAGKFQPVAGPARKVPTILKQKPVTEPFPKPLGAAEWLSAEKAASIGFPPGVRKLPVAPKPSIAPKPYKPVDTTPKPVKTFGDHVDNVTQAEAPRVINELGVNNDVQAIANLKKAGVKVNEEAVEIVPKAPSMLGVLTEQAKRKYEDGMNLFVRSISTGLKKQGIYGTWLATKLQYIRDESAIQLGRTLSEIMPAMKGLSKSELEQLRKAQDLGEEITSPKVQAAYDIIKAKDVDVGRQAQALELTIKTSRMTPSGEIKTVINPWQPLENHYPHVRNFAELLSNPTKQQEAIAYIIKTKQAKNAAEAKDALALYLGRNIARRVGNLEFSRTLNLPGYETNPMIAWEQYFRNAYGRLEEAKALGPNDEKVKIAIWKIGEMGGNDTYAREAFDRVVKIHRDEITGREFMEAARTTTVLTKMALSAITNMQQASQIFAVNNIHSFAKGLSQIFTKEGKEFAVKAGTVLDSTISSLMSQGVGGGKLAQKYLRATGMTMTERFLRTWSTLSGRQMLADTFKAIKKNPADKGTQRLLLKMGFNPKQLLKKQTLSEHDFLMAGRNMTQRTQFLVDPLDLPLFAASPWGKLTLQLKTFAYKQTQFVKDELLVELAHGNPKPLIKFTLAADVLGESTQDIKAFIKRQPRKYEFTDPKRHIENIVGGGALGILQDVFHNVSGVNPNLGLLIVPVAAAPLSDIAIAGKYAVKGEGKKAARKLARNIPFVGPTISGLLTEQPKTRKSRKRREFGR